MSNTATTAVERFIAQALHRKRPARYAYDEQVQRDLAERWNLIGHDTTACYRRRCRECGRIFYAGTPAARWCSPDCARQGHNLNRRQARKVWRRCGHCGCWFTASRSDARYCCGAHRQAAHRARAQMTPTTSRNADGVTVNGISEIRPSRPAR